jgi:hypothetical protein
MPICFASLSLHGRARPLVPATPFGDAQAEQGALERSRRLGFQFRAPAFGQRSFGALACFLRPDAVDFFGSFRYVGQHDHSIGTHFEKTARDGQMTLFTAGAEGEFTNIQGGNKRLMPVQDTEVTLRATGDHNVDIVLQDDALGRDDFEPDSGHARPLR